MPPPRVRSIIRASLFQPTITTTDAGDPNITILQNAVASVAAGRTLTVALRFRDPLFDPINYTLLLFSDPLAK
jgi:hypothetical protein